ncbi:MAG: DUF3237 family protein [Anaerolineales bacterium]
MKLKALYRVSFNYPREWEFPLASTESLESQNFFLATGHCEGRIVGSFQGANHPGRRSDGTYLPNFQGVIETIDGAIIYFDYRGFGRAYPPGRRQIVVSGTHISNHEKYKWLNDTLCVGSGEVRSNSDKAPELVINWEEVLWEPTQ